MCAVLVRGERAPRADIEAAAALIASRVRARIDEIVDSMVERYVEVIGDYARLDEETLTDVRGFSLDNLRCFVDNLDGELLPPAELERARQGGARRVHQDVSLDSLLRAWRLWGDALWDAVLDAARLDRPAEREAALLLAGRVMRHVDSVSTACTQGYVEEAQGLHSDREVLRRDLLDSLLGGHAEPEALRREAASLHLALEDSYVVVLARGEDPARGGESRPPLSVRAALRNAVEVAKRRMRPDCGSLLVGVRSGEIVALYPAASACAIERVKSDCAEFAEAVAPRGFRVGLGSWHPELGGVPASYAEAREAIDFALRNGIAGRVVAFDEIVIEHVLRSSQQARRMLTDLIKPLREYDAAHRSQLIPTLRAYGEAGNSLTRAAQALFINPNTVVYRLRRVHELTGRDPHEPSDLLLLLLAVKVIGED